MTAETGFPSRFSLVDIIKGAGNKCSDDIHMNDLQVC